MPKSFNQNSKNYEAGFSLIELIISITVFTIIMGAIYGLLQIGLISRNSLNKRSETTKNVRAAINSVGKDIVNAGLGFSRVGGLVPDDFANEHLDIPVDKGKERDLLTGIIAGNDISESDLSVTGTKNDVIAFAYRDLAFNGGNPLNIIDAPILSIIDNSNVLKTPTNGCTDCKPFDLYLVESKDGKQAIVMATAIPDSNTLVLGRNDPINLNQEVLNAGSNERSILTKCVLGNTNNCINYSAGVTAKRIFWMSYSVDVNGTLVRTSYGNNTGAAEDQQIQKFPLAYNVQNFQVRYLMQDGTVSDDPSNGNTTPLKMNEVVQVEISVTVQAEASA